MSYGKRGTVLACVHDAVAFEGDACLPWPFSKVKGGYGQVWLDGARWDTHRLVCWLAHGPPPTPKHEAAHSCNNKPCINKRHLRWATAAENAADRVAAGNTMRGERSHFAVITEEQVPVIISDKRTHDAIAKDYGVCRQTISFMKSGVSWSWLTGIQRKVA